MSFYFFIIKEKVHHISGTSKFDIARKVLKECCGVYSRYVAALPKKKKKEKKRQKEEKRTMSC